MANVPTLRFPGFTGKWQKMSIGTLASKVGSGSTPKGGSAIYEDNGHPFVRSQNIGNGILLLDDIAHIPDEIHNQQKNTEIREQDVLLNITGASIGRCAIADSRIVGGNVNQHVCIIRATSLNPTFLSNFILSQRGQKQIESFQAGGNREGLNFEQVRSIKISIPQRKEQDKISSLLGLLDERIALQSKLIDCLKSLMDGVRQRVIGKEGETYELSDVLRETHDKTSRNNQYEVLSSSSTGIFRQSEYFKRDIASEDNVGYKILRKGQIVLSPQNLWLGNINFNDHFDIGMVSPSYKVFDIIGGHNKFYIAYSLKTPKIIYDYANASEQGASIVRRNLNMDNFLTIKIKLPSKKRQNEIAQLLIQLQCCIDISKRLLDLYRNQKNYLLSAMFI